MSTNLQQLINSDSEHDRKQAVIILARSTSESDHDLLQKIAEEDLSTEVRYFAKKALHYLKSGDKTGTERKTEKIDRSKIRVFSEVGRDEKLSIIASMCENRENSNLSTLVMYLNNENDPLVVSSLLIAIGKHGSETEINVIAPYLENESPRVRASAIESLEIIGHSRIYPFILTRLDDSDNRVRANAIRAVKKLKPSETLDIIKTMLTSELTSMQASAAFVLQFFPSEENVALLLPLLESKIANVKNNALKTLIKYNEKGVRKVEKIFQQKSSEFLKQEDENLDTLEKELSSFLGNSADTTESPDTKNFSSDLWKTQGEPDFHISGISEEYSAQLSRLRSNYKHGNREKIFRELAMLALGRNGSFDGSILRRFSALVSSALEFHAHQMISHTLNNFYLPYSVLAKASENISDHQEKDLVCMSCKEKMETYISVSFENSSALICPKCCVKLDNEKKQRERELSESLVHAFMVLKSAGDFDPSSAFVRDGLSFIQKTAAEHQVKLPQDYIPFKIRNGLVTDQEILRALISQDTDITIAALTLLESIPLPSQTEPLLNEYLNHENPQIRFLSKKLLSKTNPSLLDVPQEKKAKPEPEPPEEKKSAQVAAAVSKPARISLPAIELKDKFRLWPYFAIGLPALYPAVIILLYLLTGSSSAAYRLYSTGFIGKESLISSVKNSIISGSTSEAERCIRYLKKSRISPDLTIPVYLSLMRGSNPELSELAVAAVEQEIKTSESAIPALILLYIEKDDEQAGKILNKQLTPPEKAFSLLKKSFDNNDPIVRKSSVTLMGTFCPDLPQTVTVVESALSDASPGTRLGALKALGKKGTFSQSLSQKLGELLSDYESEIRSETLKVLESGDPDLKVMTQSLISALQSDDVRVRKYATEKIAQLGPEASATAPLLKSLSHKNHAIRAASASALLASGASSAAVLPSLLELTDDDSPESKAQLQPVLEHFLNSQDSVQGLSACLKSPSQKVRLKALDLILKHKNASDFVSLMIETMKTADSKEAEKFRGALEKLGHNSTAGLPALIKALADQTVRVQKYALETLSGMGSQASSTAEHIVPLLNSDNQDIVRLSLKVLSDISPSPVLSFPVSVKFLKSPDPVLHGHAITLMETMLNHKEDAADILGKNLDNPDPFIRQTSIEMLGKIKTTDPEIIAKAVNLLSEPSDKIRSAAEISVSRLGASAVNPLIRFINERPDSRLTAIKVIERIGPEAAEATPSVCRFLNDKKLQQNAIMALGSIGSASAAAVPDLLSILKGNEKELLSLTIKAIEKIGTPASEAVPVLTEFLTHRDPYVRRFAISAIFAVEPDLRKSVPIMIKALNGSDSYLRDYAGDVLLSLEKKPLDYIPALSASLRDPDSFVRTHALKTLARFGKSAASAIPAVTELSRNDQSWTVKTTAQETLTAISGN